MKLTETPRHLPPQLELKAGNWFQTTGTLYTLVPVGNDHPDQLMLTGNILESDASITTPATGRAIVAVRVGIDQLGQVFCADPIDSEGRVVVETSMVTAFHGQTLGTTELVRPVADPASLSDNERSIYEAEMRELNRFKDYPLFRTIDDIHRSLRDGWLVRASDRIEQYYKVSANMELKYAPRAMLMLLGEIGIAWHEELVRRDLPYDGKFLVVASLVRTQEKQQRLIAEGYPAAPRSTHVVGFAADIGKKWFDTKEPEHGAALLTVLDRFATDGWLTYVVEGDCWHVALCVEYLQRGTDGPPGTRIIR